MCSPSFLDVSEALRRSYESDRDFPEICTGLRTCDDDAGDGLRREIEEQANDFRGKV